MSTKKKDVSHQTQSFDQLVAKSQTNALKPYIEQQVAMQLQMYLQKFSKVVTDEITFLKLRTISLEEVLKNNGTFNESELSDMIARKEDLMMGYKEVGEVAAVGDLLRIEIASKDKETGKYLIPERLAISSLMTKVEDRVQTYEELESALVGLKTGESAELTIKALPKLDDGSEQPAMEVLLKVLKVSRKAT